MDGINNASERAIGRSKVRYKTMRGYKGIEPTFRPPYYRF